MKNFFIVGIFNSANEFISLIIYVTLSISLLYQQSIQRRSWHKFSPTMKCMTFAFICNAVVLLFRQLLRFESYSGDMSTLISIFLMMQILFPAVYCISNKEKSFNKGAKLFIGAIFIMAIVNLSGLLLLKFEVGVPVLAILVIKLLVPMILLGFTTVAIINFRTHTHEHYEYALFVTSLLIPISIIFMSIFKGVDHHYGVVIFTLTLINIFVFFRFIIGQKHMNSEMIDQLSEDSKFTKLEENKANDLKERLVRYFEDEKPYLNKNLSINEVSLYLYTNKTYLSKIINDDLGQNFNQFVNSFRIEEVQKLFNANRDLSIHELRKLSGFGCMASFTIAFRVFLGSSPADWCKANRNQMNINEKARRC